MKIIGDGFRKRRAEHRDRRGEDQARAIAVARGADRFNERTRAGEMEDHVGPAGDSRARHRGVGNIGGAGRDAAGKTLRLLRRADIDQRELIDRLAVEPAGSDHARHELAADHSGGAGDENVHSLPVMLREGGASSTPCRSGPSPYTGSSAFADDDKLYSAIPPSTRWVW